MNCVYLITALFAAIVQAKRDVYVTGFGKFPEVQFNPTSALAERLANDPNVKRSKVLETSAEGCLEMIAPFREEAANSGNDTVFLHLGVNPAAGDYAVERVAYNLADFHIPDERGWRPHREPIVSGGPQQINTVIPVDSIVRNIQPSRGTSYPSTDPGRYVCNYIYYQSLLWSQQFAQSGRQRIQILFIHVPSFNSISMEAQLTYLSQVIELLAQDDGSAGTVSVQPDNVGPTPNPTTSPAPVPVNASTMVPAPVDNTQNSDTPDSTTGGLADRIFNKGSWPNPCDFAPQAEATASD